MACDYCSWLDRGWCRMEVWCNLYLEPEESMMIFPRTRERGLRGNSSFQTEGILYTHYNIYSIYIIYYILYIIYHILYIWTIDEYTTEKVSLH